MNTPLEHTTSTESDWEASVSAWIDGEADMRADELDTPYGRQIWDQYHLIGDVMRSEDLAIRPSDRFYVRVAAALDEEPVILAPRPTIRHHFWRYGLSGVAVAAAVASVVWVAAPMLAGSPSADTAAPVLAQVDEPAEPADPELADYMAAHRAMAGSGPVRQVSFDGMGSR